MRKTKTTRKSKRRISIETFPFAEIIRYSKGETHPLVDALPYHHLVPKDPEAHVKWRIWLRRRALEEPGFQKILWKMCQKDPLFFINAFCWIDEPRIGEGEGSGLIPFNSWCHQDPVIANLAAYIGRRHSIIDKSRAQGASWLVLCLLLWVFLFRPRSKLGMASITREMADDPDSPESLGWKFDMLLEFLPKWMTLDENGKPIVDRNISKSTWTNRKNGATLKAHSATKGLGRGGRYTVYFLDEAAFFLPGKDTEAVQGLVGAGTNCIILASTPNGTETEHSKRLDDPQQWLTHILDWTDNPYQNQCLYTVNESGNVVKLDDIPFPPGYAPVLDKLFPIRSPWFDRKASDNRNNVIYINREWNRDRGGSRARPFEKHILDKARASCMAPFRSGDLSFDQFDLDDIQFVVGGRKSWNLWFTLENERPPRDQYVFGVDIASGAGGDWSSNSNINIWNSSGVQMASFARHDITPVDLAYLCMAAWNWFSLDNRKPLVVPEVNAGGGKLFLKTLLGLGCSRIYAPPQRADRDGGKRLKKYGYWNSNTLETLSPLIRELTASTITVRDATMLDEAAQYIYDQNGSVVHPKAVLSEEGSSRGMNHGDRAIGGALAIHGIKSLGGLKPVSLEKKVSPTDYSRLAEGKPGSLAYRITQWKKGERERTRGNWEF
jgi:hypothetical protein